MTRLVDADELHEIVNWSHEKPPYSKKKIHRLIDMTRTVDAEPVRHGRWEKVRGHQMVRRCSECGDIMPRDRAFTHYIYCGHCGARMDKDETD